MAVVSGRSEGGGKIFAKFGNVLLQMWENGELESRRRILYRAAKLCKKSWSKIPGGGDATLGKWKQKGGRNK